MRSNDPFTMGLLRELNETRLLKQWTSCLAEALCSLGITWDDDGDNGDNDDPDDDVDGGGEDAVSWKISIQS